jgi:hypothetical protein
MITINNVKEITLKVLNENMASVSDDIGIISKEM